MKYRLWLNIPSRRIRMVSDDMDGPHDATLLMNDFIRLIPDAVAGIDAVENRTVKHSPPMKGTPP